jgi:putative NIF3 family GTP cyclohydrolase 1 type 2
MIAHERSVITPVADIGVPGFEEAGYGRIVSFRTPQKLGDLLKRISTFLGGLPGLSLATPQSWPRERRFEKSISSVGICAGSGGSLLRDLRADLLFTGELSHHEALTAVERGQCVITAFHSNTERAFLKQRTKDALTTAIENILDEESKGLDKTTGTVMDKLIAVDVSETDRDPFEIVICKGIINL